MGVHFLYGILLAVIGFLAPAMLNMTTVRTSIDKGRNAGFLFALGASLVNSVQSLISFSFLRFLDSNPNVIDWLKRIGVLVLFTLAYFFYQQSKKVISARENTKQTHPFILGAFLSSINMLAMPYYFASALGLEASGQIIATPPYIYFMAVGVLIGGFFMFSVYAILAEIVAKRSQFITKNLNIMLSTLFTILAIAVLVDLVI
ncbi:MAG: LysE family transporter [Saprospiraceae bacterium]|nr:LysE family transporter [Saprospiraceae bacterium]